MENALLLPLFVLFQPCWPLGWAEEGLWKTGQPTHSDIKGKGEPTQYTTHNNTYQREADAQPVSFVWLMSNPKYVKVGAIPFITNLQNTISIGKTLPSFGAPLAAINSISLQLQQNLLFRHHQTPNYRRLLTICLCQPLDLHHRHNTSFQLMISSTVWYWPHRKCQGCSVLSY